MLSANWSCKLKAAGVWKVLFIRGLNLLSPRAGCAKYYTKRLVKYCYLWLGKPSPSHRCFSLRMSSPWVDGHISVRSRNCAEAMVNNTFSKRNSTRTSLFHIFRPVFFRSNNINTTLKHRIIEVVYLPLSILY